MAEQASPTVGEKASSLIFRKQGPDKVPAAEDSGSIPGPINAARSFRLEPSLGRYN